MLFSFTSSCHSGPAFSKKDYLKAGKLQLPVIFTNCQYPGFQSGFRPRSSIEISLATNRHLFPPLEMFWGEEAAEAFKLQPPLSALLSQDQSDPRLGKVWGAVSAPLLVPMRSGAVGEGTGSLTPSCG